MNAVVPRPGIQIALLLALFVFVILGGCGGTPSYLPKPRKPKPSNDNVVAADAPTAAGASGSPAADSAAGTASPAAPLQPATAPTAASASPTTNADAAPVTTPAPALKIDYEALQLQIEPLPPGQQVTVARSREESIRRMRKITAAIAAYAAEKGSFPPASYYDEQIAPAVSWRVLILPYLGHRDLFERFRLNEPYNSPHNQQLLREIPAVYQSVERPDEKTNFLVPLGDSTLFPQATRAGVSPASITDGLENTVILLEVDHPWAVEWTSPSDYILIPQDPRRQLGLLRDDGFFIGWGDGTIGCWPKSAPDQAIAGLYTIAGKEPGLRNLSIVAAAGDHQSLARPQSTLPNQDPDNLEIDGANAPPAARPSPSNSAANNVPNSPRGANSIDGADGVAKPRIAPPSPEVRGPILALLRETYAESAADRKADKRQQSAYAKRLLADSARYTADPAERYVILDVALNLATQASDIETALTICERIEEDFEVDLLPRRVEVLAGSLRLPLETQENQRVFRTSLELIETALAADLYEDALTLQSVALAAARRAKDPRSIARLTERREEITEARRHYLEVRELLGKLSSDTPDPQAHQTVGTYLCFIKGDWQRGLPLLQSAADSRLVELATAELASPTTPAEQLSLADRWWSLADASAEMRQQCQRRAAHWYRQALPRLPDNLLTKVRAQMRLAEFDRNNLVAAP